MATKKLNDDTPSFKQQKKALKQSNKLAALTAKGERIKAGTEPTLYDKAATITGNVAKVADSAAEVVSAVKNRSTPFKQQKGGAMSDIKSGVKQVAKGVKKGMTDAAKNTNKVVKAAVKSSPQYKAYKVVGAKAKKVDDALEKRYPNYTGKGTAYDTVKKGVKSLLGYKTGGIARGRNISQKAAERKTAKGKGYISSIMGENPSGDKGTYVPFTRAGRKDAKTKGMVSSKEMKPSRQIMKTGGMVNPNAKLKATATAGSRGVKAGVNPKAAASKVARGRSGGTSAAPKKATPGRK